MELELGPLRFGIVGAGSLGCTIGRALQARGLELVHASSASAEGRARASRLLQVPVHEDPLAACEHVDCVLVCVPDGALAATVEHLRARPATSTPMRLRVVSCSAFGGTSLLAPLTSAGHTVGVLHPIASVVSGDDEPSVLAGSGAAIGATDAAERTFLHALAHALELLPFDLDEDAWALHAATCLLAANGTSAVLAAAEQLAAEAGVHPGVARSAYGRLAAAAVDRSVVAGPIEALGGPIIRGDAAALAAQVAAVRASSTEVDALFIPVVASIANRAFTSGRIDMPTHRALLEAVLDPTQFDEHGFRYGDEIGPTSEEHD